MKTISKRLAKEKLKIEDRLYTPEEAIKLLKNVASAKFIESAEAHINLNINPKYADQQLRANLVLPKGSGKTVRLAVIAQPEQQTDEIKEKVELLGDTELINDIEKNIINFDMLIVTPEMMPSLAKLGKILGPRGLMPSPKAGTVTTDLNKSIEEFKSGKIEYRADKTGIVHVLFGKTSFSENDLNANLKALYQSIEKNKPSGAKGRYIKSFTICSTMSPAITIDYSLWK